MLIVLMFPVQASAVDLFSDTCKFQSAKTSATCSSKTTTDPISGPQGILLKVTTFIALIAGIAAVIVLIAGGIKFVTSNGDSSGVNSARQTIIYALIGLVVIVLAQAIISFVIYRI